MLCHYKRNSTYSHRNSRSSGNLAHGGIGVAKRMAGFVKYCIRAQQLIGLSAPPPSIDVRGVGSKLCRRFIDISRRSPGRRREAQSNSLIKYHHFSVFEAGVKSHSSRRSIKSDMRCPLKANFKNEMKSLKTQLLLQQRPGFTYIKVANHLQRDRISSSNCVLKVYWLLIPWLAEHCAKTRINFFCILVEQNGEVVSSFY
jgi:hypothetical protein